MIVSLRQRFTGWLCRADLLHPVRGDRRRGQCVLLLAPGQREHRGRVGAGGQRPAPPPRRQRLAPGPGGRRGLAADRSRVDARRRVQLRLGSAVQRGDGRRQQQRHQRQRPAARRGPQQRARLRFRVPRPAPEQAPAAGRAPGRRGHSSRASTSSTARTSSFRTARSAPGPAPRPTFGQPTSAADPRQVQFGVRVDF